jgi:Protein of unknown function (DUF1559)
MAVAIHSYQETHGTLPPHAVYGKDGQPLLSWRVLILPFIEQEKLYKKFRLDESWDSPHNIALLSEMPRIYGRYDDRTTAEPHTTFYQVFVGRGVAFEGVKGMKLAEDFPDGTSNTILIVEAGEAVPWTKPEDLPYERDRPLPTLGGLFKETIRAALADGSIHSFTRDTSEKTIRAAITRNGGDSLGSDW